MITETDRTIINECAKKYDIEKAILFGSALNSDNYHDIDIAVKSGNPRFFFNYMANYSENYPNLLIE